MRRAPRVVGAAVVLVLTAAALVMRSRNFAAVAEGRAAPRFVAWTTDSLHPEERSLDDYSAQPLLLNVWATWCDPCREEMPSIERLYRDYRERGLRVAAVSIDNSGQLPLVREFVRELGLSFDILHDARGTLMTQYQMLGVPQTFLISRRGAIVATRYASDWSSPESRALVDSLLRR